MVSAVENLTRLVGTILERTSHPDLDGWDLVTVQVDRAEPVPGKADLLSVRSQEPLRIAVRRELLGDATVGWQLAVRVKVTPSGPVAEPYPEEANLQLSEPQPGQP